MSEMHSSWTDIEEVFRSPIANPEIRIRRLRDDVDIPKYETARAAGFDLAIADDLDLKPHEIKRAPTGLVFAAPRFHMLYITFRSSTPVRWGVTVLEGILDEDYCGDEDECSLQVMNLEGVPKIIPAGTRIAQGIFLPITRAEFIENDEMGESRGGFGSTG